MKQLMDFSRHRGRAGHLRQLVFVTCIVSRSEKSLDEALIGLGSDATARYPKAQPPHGARGTRPFQLWGTCGTKCIWPPATFATDCRFFAGQRGQPNKFSPNLLAIFKGRRGIGKGMGETEV